jgi:hypothetical protein
MVWANFLLGIGIAVQISFVSVRGSSIARSLRG